MSIGKYAKRIGTKTADLATVPLNLVGGLFGNPFDPQGGHQVINTPSQIDYLNNLVNQSGEKQGILSYGDYGTNFNLSDLKDPTAFSTAMTMGGTGFTKADTGDITYSGGKYDFDGAVPFIDQGGLMGKAYNLGGGLANLVNDIRQRNPGVTGTDYFDDVNISQPPGTDVGIMSNLANLFGSSAMANEPMSIEDFQVQNIKDRPIASVPSNFLNYRFQNARTPFTPVREGITSLKDKLGTIKDKGIDVGRMALSGIGRFAAGPIGGILGSIIGSVKESPEQRAMRDFYGNEFGLDDIGRVQSGVMKGYSPVSLFGGVGLNQAIDKRIAKINQTLAKQKKNRSKVLENRLKELKELRAKESAAASAALEAQRMGRRPSAPSGDGAKDSGGPTGGYSYDSGGRQGFGYGL